MESTVALPNSTKRTTPLGVGLATLMREPSPAAQQRLLHAAYDAGFRHFDTAPSYGLGAAEGVLGRFLRTRPDGVTVGTKLGILARGNAGVMRLVQRPARALIRRFPGLRGRATQSVGGMVHTRPDFSAATRTRSLEGSLRALGVDAIDLLLLHEPEPDDVTHEVADWLAEQKRRGTLRAVGVATRPEFAVAIVRRWRPLFDAVQVPGHVLDPVAGLLGAEPVALRVIHSVLAVPLARARERVQRDDAFAGELSRRAGADMRARGMLPRLLLAWALTENPRGIILVGSSSADHLRAATSAVGAFDGPALASAAELLRSTLAG